MSAPRILNVKDLALGYSSAVFCSASFELFGGESVSILGENGSGKTLLFNALMGLKKPLSGSIHFFDKDISLLSPRIIFEKVAWVTAQKEDYPIGLCCRTYLQCVAKFYSRWSWDLADKFKIDLSKKIANLSLGESSKIRLLKGIAQQPSLLILDELTGNLSPASKKVVVRALIDQMEKNQLSLLNFTHYEGEAKRLSDRSLLLTKNGLVNFEGGEAQYV